MGGLPEISLMQGGLWAERAGGTCLETQKLRNTFVQNWFSKKKKNKHIFKHVELFPPYWEFFKNKCMHVSPEMVYILFLNTQLWTSS